MNELWPSLPLSEWQATRDTLHRWTQIVGKIRLALTPLVNHWWNVPLYVSARGLTTSAMTHRDRTLELEFDFVSHELHLVVSDGRRRDLALPGLSVGAFYREVFATLDSFGLGCSIWPVTVEMETPERLDIDEDHRSYDALYVERFWQILARSAALFTDFRAGFLGKCSPVHFFWGSFDLAVTRFSGRRAPDKPEADPITREAYSHEVSSVGFWPGDNRLAQPAFYSYAAPEPAGFRSAPVEPAAAYYNEALGGFYLHYDDLRAAADPDAALLRFCETTYAAAATHGAWDRASLERPSVARR